MEQSGIVPSPRRFTNPIALAVLALVVRRGNEVVVAQVRRAVCLVVVAGEAIRGAAEVAAAALQLLQLPRNKLVGSSSSSSSISDERARR